MLLDFFRNKKGLIISACILAALLVSAALAFITLNMKAFYRGISIDGVNVSGLKMEEAKALIDWEVKNIFDSQKITLRYGNSAWVIYLSDISMEYMTDEALDEAYEAGRRGNVFYRLYSIIKTRYEGAAYFSEISYDEEKLRNILLDIKKQIDKNERSATVEYGNGNITIVKEEIGRILEVDENLKMLENNIERRNLQSMDLIVRENFPRVLYDDLKDIDGVIGAFSTAFSLQDYNRCYNIKLACEKINGTVILPGEMFSMNEALGPRTLDNGYREAPVIFKNELVKGTGGGVCQVTTTLYNAVLESKLQVCARTHHSMPLTYVDLGLDATIAEDYIDFKFKNNTGFAVFVYACVEGNSVSIALLGNKDDTGLKVVLKSTVVEEYEPEGEEVIIDDSIPDNQRVVAREARKGYKAVVYRETYNKKGELTEREKISEDIYAPVKAQVKVNRNFSEDAGNIQ